MNKKDLIEHACEALKTSGVGKPITIPRRTFFISDIDGNECKFHVKQVDKRVSYNQQDVAVIVDAFLSAIEEALRGGETISIYGFGVLKPHFRAERSTLIPGTNESIKVEKRYVPKFTAGKGLTRAVRLWELSEKESEDLCRD